MLPHFVGVGSEAHGVVARNHHEAERLPLLWGICADHGALVHCGRSLHHTAVAGALRRHARQHTQSHRESVRVVNPPLCLPLSPLSLSLLICASAACRRCHPHPPTVPVRGTTAERPLDWSRGRRSIACAHASNAITRGVCHTDRPPLPPHGALTHVDRAPPLTHAANTSPQTTTRSA